MLGLINRSIECFLRDTYGDKTWGRVASQTGVTRFEVLLSYDDHLTELLLDQAQSVLAKDRSQLLEDLGTYIVAHPKQESVRRLMRFGGADFPDFILSLDDLADRARLAISDLQLPQIEAWQDEADHYSIFCRSIFPGCGHVLAGLIRAMSDDYGALSVVDYEGVDGASEVLAVQLLDTTFSEGRDFVLSVETA